MHLTVFLKVRGKLFSSVDAVTVLRQECREYWMCLFLLSHVKQKTFSSLS